MVLLQGVRTAPFERPWLTTTISESKPVEGGKSMTRLTESCWKGWEQDEDKGERAGMVRWVFTFICWQRAQLAMKQ